MSNDKLLTNVQITNLIAEWEGLKETAWDMDTFLKVVKEHLINTGYPELEKLLVREANKYDDVINDFEDYLFSNIVEGTKTRGDNHEQR